MILRRSFSVPKTVESIRCLAVNTPEVFAAGAKVKKGGEAGIRRKSLRGPDKQNGVSG
jgi:hypothetical protein